ncbi:short-chain dehydrogenase/reductase 1 [Hibiscus trionum]|uniref:Short-chain dehydrogenase/reductase n=1 Tax=Hibiscus trionum TaxID=183268 RepID=A0A9W7IUU7_HIBTR|nr:short-chain dehydrogenase/reductase 1 [Hibiscus trionum]
MAEVTKRYAVVTGANKGIGLEICKQLAQNGITVVLTARDEKRGVEALQSLKQSGLPDLLFHQLDVADPESIASLADFVNKQFGKLDILVNNAGILGATFSVPPGSEVNSINVWSYRVENYELAEECLNINYYGAKRTAEALIPLLQLSDLPRIVNVSSRIVCVKPNGGDRLKEISTGLTTEEKLSEIISEYLRDFKEGTHESNGWPTFLPAYTVSKVALNAYTRILANKYPDFCINCVCPGFAKTDINYNAGTTTVKEGAETPVKLALLPKGGPSGLFFAEGEPVSPEFISTFPVSAAQ